jgi:predicted dinucleotide-binding enzyme
MNGHAIVEFLEVSVHTNGKPQWTEWTESIPFGMVVSTIREYRERNDSVVASPTNDVVSYLFHARVIKAYENYPQEKL